MTSPDANVTRPAVASFRTAARTLAGALVAGLLIAATDFVTLRESFEMELRELSVLLVRVAVHWTLATIPLGLAIGVLELRGRGRIPSTGQYALAVMAGAGAGALVMAMHMRWVDASLTRRLVGIDMVPADIMLYGLSQLVFWGSVGAVLHASSLRQQRGAMLLRERELERIRSERSLAEARLAALQAQIEPEFLLTSLSEVERLYAVDPPRADRLMDALIRFLREATPLLRQQVSTLGDEARLLRAYVDVLTGDPADGQRLRLDIGERAAGTRVPAGVLLSLAQGLLGTSPASASAATLDVRAEPIGARSGVRLSIFAVTGATISDLRGLVTRVEHRLSLTCASRPSIALDHDGVRRVTLHTILLDKGGPGHDQFSGR